MIPDVLIVIVSFIDPCCRVYDVWAKYRLPLTGRPDLEVVLAEKRMCKQAEDGGREIPVKSS